MSTSCSCKFLEDALLILAVQDRKVARIAELPDILAQQAYTKGWIVEICTLCAIGPSMLSTRSFISLAAYS